MSINLNWNRYLVKQEIIKSKSDVYILVKRIATITGERADEDVNGTDERKKGVIFKNCAPFTDCISEINNTQVDNAKGIDVVMTMYNIIEYSNNYLKKSGILWQYYRDEPANAIVNSESFKSKIKMARKTPTVGNTKNVEIAEPFKYLKVIFGELLKCH